MITLVRIELEKIFRKWRTYIGFMAIGVMVPIVQLALHYTGDEFVGFATQNLQNSFEFVGNLVNGYLIAHLILQSLFVHIPFLIVLVGGDLMAGEATAGTFRLLVTRPISRSKIVLAKFIAGVIYTNLLLAFLMILSLGGSLIIFGGGDLLVLKDKIYIFAENDVLWRFFLAYGFAVLSMTTVLAISFMFSVFVENAIGPIVATMAVIIVFIILSAINIEVLRDIRPYMFTNHMAVWREFFGDPLNWEKIWESGAILAGHIIAFLSVSWAAFVRKDIQS